MTTKRRLLGICSALFLGSAAIGFAVAQVYPAVPKVVQVDPTDLFLDVVHGSPTTVSQYATAALIAGVPGYTYTVPLTGFSIAAANATQLLFLNPSGTLATGTVTFMPNPGAGQQFCIESSQTQTAITPTANTGQTISSIAAVSALVAGTPVCWYYNASLATWFRTL